MVGALVEEVRHCLICRKQKKEELNDVVKHILSVSSRRLPRFFLLSQTFDPSYHVRCRTRYLAVGNPTAQEPSTDRP